MQNIIRKHGIDLFPGIAYIKPVDGFVTIAEAVDDLTNIKDLG